MAKKIEMSDIFDFDTLENVNRLLNLLDTESKRVDSSSVVKFHYYKAKTEIEDLKEKTGEDYVFDDFEVAEIYIDVNDISFIREEIGQYSKKEGTDITLKGTTDSLMVIEQKEEVLMYWQGLDLLK